ncbi:MAG: 2-C-methyl-D-erythritol 2,4-cyclodiphosphate synthase [Planctomycetes bacterium]|jgi:2-C-methyl-D-erythritol 2,4-cyclodiphosphate synthase|nr:2-C-methyl-D-erythritol 2,4-cyclodiphosphate synthase [Planctomycetota bacterium]
MARIGFGFDSHRFAPDRPLVLGGVQIEHTLGLAAHSDGDVILHALTDAILGAIAAGDIGEQFPDSDPRWADADSRIFVSRAIELAGRQGLRVGNADITVVTEVPKLNSHKAAIAESVAAMLGREPADVAVKAKTSEGMGVIGSGEGIACFATVLLEDVS